MAAVVPRLSTGVASTGDGGLLTEEEMAQLQDLTEEIAKTVEEPKQLEIPQNDNEKSCTILRLIPCSHSGGLNDRYAC